MDKYEYEIKTEQIRKLILLKEYDTAKKIADGMKWGKEKNPRLLSEVAELYVMSGEYDEAIDLLLQAYDYAHPGRRILKRLVDIAILAKNYRNAAEYCEEFHDLAPRDTEYYLMRYKVDEAAGNVSVERRIALLERYTASEMSEEWKLRLAQLYAEAGRVSECVKLCDEIIFLFCNGEYVIAAMELKQQYAPLDKFQQEKYDHREEYLQKYHEEQEALRLQQEEEEREATERLLEKERKRAEKLGIVDTPKEEEPQQGWRPQLPTSDDAMQAVTLEEYDPNALSEAEAQAQAQAQAAAEAAAAEEEAARAAAQQAAYEAAEERRKRLLEIALREEEILTTNTPEVKEHKLITMMEDTQSSLASNITSIIEGEKQPEETAKKKDRDLEETLTDFVREAQVNVVYDEDRVEATEETAQVAEEAVEAVTEAVEETAQAAEENVQVAEEAVESVTEAVEETAQAATDEVAEVASEMEETVAEAAEETVEAAEEVAEAAEEVAEAAEEVSESIIDQARKKKRGDTGYLTADQKQAILNMVRKHEEVAEAPAEALTEEVTEAVETVAEQAEEVAAEVTGQAEEIAAAVEAPEAFTAENEYYEGMDVAEIDPIPEEQPAETFDETYVKDAEELQEEPEVDFDKAQDEDILAEVSKNLNRNLELQEMEQGDGLFEIPGPEMPGPEETYTNVFEGDIDEAAFEETYQNVMEQAALEELIAQSEAQQEEEDTPSGGPIEDDADEAGELTSEEVEETPVSLVVRSQLGEIQTEAKVKDNAADEVCFAITCDNEQKGLAYAIELLKRLPKESERPSRLARTTAEKLNENGLLVQEDRLENVLLVIEHAGQLSEELVNELLQFRKHYENAIVVIIDTEEGLRKLFARRPELGLIFVLRYAYEDKTADEWFEFMKEYAEALECVIAPNAEYLIKEYLQDRLDHDDIVFETLLKEIVDDAEHEADRFTVKNLFASAFGRKFNKDGWLILKARHF
ncbi:MAG: hypothetical protein J5757_05020 [Lachnospiraceae bacterium]|nr:hypothetical protein [Lachnospiraceae bacterium]